MASDPSRLAKCYAGWCLRPCARPSRPLPAATSSAGGKWASASMAGRRRRSTPSASRPPRRARSPSKSTSRTPSTRVAARPFWGCSRPTSRASSAGSASATRSRRSSSAKTRSSPSPVPEASSRGTPLAPSCFPLPCRTAMRRSMPVPGPRSRSRRRDRRRPARGGPGRVGRHRHGGRRCRPQGQRVQM